MSRLHSVTVRYLVVLVLFCVTSVAAYPAGTNAESSPRTAGLGPRNSPLIVIGFLGGFVAHDEPHHPEVRVIQTLRQDYPSDAYFELFENKRIDKAYHLIVDRLDVNRNGSLSDDEKRRACIELFGHSWGASAVVTLSRKLARDGIPVRLTVQVDSVAKPFQNDSVIPPNVRQAANFYQARGLIHGESKIVAADPSRTTILGNYRLDYDREPQQCRGFSWHARFFTRSHIEIECDPKVWSQVETLLREKLPQVPVKGARSAEGDLLVSPTNQER